MLSLYQCNYYLILTSDYLSKRNATQRNTTQHSTKQLFTMPLSTTKKCSTHPLSRSVMQSVSSTSLVLDIESSTTSLEMNIFGLFLVFLTPMLGGFLYGFDIGATSFVLVMLLNPSVLSDKTVWWTDISSTQQGLIVSGLSLGALVGSHMIFMYLSEKIGRRMELRLCSIFYIVGSIFNVMSGTILKDSITLGFFSLFVGRLLYGIGVSFVMHGAPAYLAEMSPHKIRGAVVSAKETVIVGGIVVGYTVGNWVSKNPLNSWTNLYGLCGLLAIPMFILTYYIPRSKRWLIMHGLNEEAYESMMFVYKGDIREGFESLADSVLAGNLCRSNSINKGGHNKPSLLEPQYRKAVIASVGLIFFQQFSGQPSVLSYATVLFKAAGWSGNASVVSSVLMMMTSAVTVLLVERLGRKFLLCTCCIVMMISISALSISFWGWDDTIEAEPVGSSQKYVILFSMFLYIAGYQIGFGPINWCIVSEVFPLEIRGKAIALFVEMNYALNFGVQFIIPIIKETLGWGRTFSIFGVILAFAFFFIRAYVPETSGLTLEEIQDILNGEDLNDEEQCECTEETNLLKGVASSSPLFGAAWSLEEMENQIVRTTSGAWKLEEMDNSNNSRR